MKKSVVLMVMLCGLLVASCGKKNCDCGGGEPNPTNQTDLPEATLAGSVNTGYCYMMAARGEYNGVPLSGFRGDLLGLWKKSDTEIELTCHSDFKEGRFGIFIPKLRVSGKPYDVSFDHKALDAYTHIGTTEYPATVTVTGWIKADKMVEIEGERYPDYKCELHLNCQWGKNETMNATITSIKSPGGVIVNWFSYSLFTWVNNSGHEITLSAPKHDGGFK